MSETLKKNTTGANGYYEGLSTTGKQVENSTEWSEQTSIATGFRKVYRSGLTDSVASLSSTNSQKYENGRMLVTSGALKMTFEAPMKIGASAHKLLMMGIEGFTPLNAPKVKPEHLRISIPLSVYAEKRYKDENPLLPRPTATPEEEEKEQKRIVYARENLFKKIRKDIQVLRGQLEYEETVRGKTYRYANTSILGSGYIDGASDEIILEFTLAFGEYIVQNPLSQFSDALYSLLDDKYNTAYLLGLKLQYHYNIENNQIKGTADRLMIESILKYLLLPTYEDLVKSEHQYEWEKRIKEPFEKALDDLVKCGFLAPEEIDPESGETKARSWQYARKNGEPITDEEMRAGLTLSYDSWSKLYLQFKINNAPDHSRAISASRERSADKADEEKRKERNEKRRARYAARKKKATEETGEK